MLPRAHRVLAGHLGDRPAVRACRVAEALTRDPELKGQRAIEEASGITRTHLKTTVLPEEGETDAYGLLRCAERGLVDWEAEEFEVGSYAVVPDTAGICPSMCSSSSISTSASAPATPEKTEMTTTAARGGSDSSGIAPETAELLAEGQRALLDPKVIAALDPRRDTWAPWSAKAEKELGYVGLGDHGWALAVLVGLRDVELPMAELRKLTGLSVAANRELVALLEKAHMAQRVKRGRTTVVVFHWTLFLIEGEAGHDEFSTRAERARLKSEKAHRTRVRMSPAERLAWGDIWGHRSDESIAAMTDIEREYWLKCRTDPKVEAAHVEMYEKGLENFGRMVREHLAWKEAEKAPEKPVEAIRVRTLGDLPPEDFQARVARLKNYGRVPVGV